MKKIAKIVSITTLAVVSLSAAAQARPDLRQMSCSQAQNMVYQYGAVVFTTGPHTYKRYVSNRRYCDRWQRTYPLYGPTRDNLKCVVGYECREPLFQRFN